ncbi:MAG: hypothetical protein JSR82_12425 [Verrucomicrobia bacterium]|nr:hypothetical protein [Verrucomicrobiota bacterium]
MNATPPPEPSPQAAAARVDVARLLAEARQQAEAPALSAEDFARAAEAALDRYPSESFTPGGTLRPAAPPHPVTLSPLPAATPTPAPISSAPASSAPTSSAPTSSAPASPAAPLPFPAPRPWARWSLAAAAAVLLAGGFLLRPLLFRGDDQLRDGPLRVTRDGRIAHPEALPGDLLASLESSIRQRSAAVLLGDAGPLRGSGLADLPNTALDVFLNGAQALTGAALELLQPLSGATVEDERPELRWAPRPGATRYVVRLQQPGESDTTWQSPELPASQTSWRPPQPLTRGETYRWSVTALDASGQPVASSPAAALRILSAADLASLGQLRRTYGGSHLVLAAAYARLGMEAEARGEIAELARKEPDSALARELAGSLRPK